MTQYIWINKDAAFFKRETRRVERESIDKLIADSEEEPPPTVRQPDNYHTCYNHIQG